MSTPFECIFKTFFECTFSRIELTFFSSCSTIPVRRFREVLTVFKYKIDVMAALKAAGFSSYRLAQVGDDGKMIFGQAAMQKFRKGEKLPSWDELGKLCALLGCGPWDIVEYIPENTGL